MGAYVYTWGDGDIFARFTGVTISGHEEGIYLGYYATGPSGSNYDIAISDSKIVDNSPSEWTTAMPPRTSPLSITGGAT